MNLRENYVHLKQEAYAGLQKREDSKRWIRMLAPISSDNNLPPNCSQTCSCKHNYNVISLGFQ